MNHHLPEVVLGTPQVYRTIYTVRSHCPISARFEMHLCKSLDANHTCSTEIVNRVQFTNIILRGLVMIKFIS